MHFIALLSKPIATDCRGQGTVALMHVKADIGDRRDKGLVQRYVIPSVIVVGVIVGTFALLYMTLYGTHP